MSKQIKDKKIIIYKLELVKDKYGDLSEKWKPIHPGKLWAYTRHLSANELSVASTTHYQETAYFTINWREGICPDMIILYKDTWYNITRIDPFEGYKNDIKVFVKTALGADIPNPEDIVPYGA